MVDARFRFCYWAVPLILVGTFPLAVLDLHTSSHLTIGYVLGAIFGQTSLAAAWTVFGPLPLVWRLPLSVVWLALPLGAMAISIGPQNLDVIFVTAACVPAQWLLVQLPLWVVALVFGVRLLHRSESPRLAHARDRQFGIGQLMIFTAIVGIAFGIGRSIVTTLLSHGGMGPTEPTQIFLAAAAIVITLPLLLAALLPKFAGPAVAIVVALIGLATAWELPLIGRLQNNGFPNSDQLVSINAFTSAWILLFVVGMRFSGYRLAGPVANNVSTVAS